MRVLKAFMFLFNDYYCIHRHLKGGVLCKRHGVFGRRLGGGRVYSKSMICGPEFSDLHSHCISFLQEKKNPQNSLDPYQHDTRKPNPDHLQMYSSPRFNSRRRFLGEASFRKSACQIREALGLVSSLSSRFLSTHKVNVHREWA